jgi:hypothetical protein
MSPGVQCQRGILLGCLDDVVCVTSKDNRPHRVNDQAVLLLIAEGEFEDQIAAELLAGE